MKKTSLILIFVGVLIIIFFMIFRLGGEDSWIKDSQGVWVKHGSPSETPDYVFEQQEAINCSLGLYKDEKNNGAEFSSQCLGTCGNYAVDIVFVPRNTEDNLAENQCEDYKTGKIINFIELDKYGNVVGVV